MVDELEARAQAVSEGANADSREEEGRGYAAREEAVGAGDEALEDVDIGTGVDGNTVNGSGKEVSQTPRDVQEEAVGIERQDEDSDGDDGFQAMPIESEYQAGLYPDALSEEAPARLSTPTKTRLNGISVHSPPPPPSPTFRQRSTPTRSHPPSRGVSPSPPTVTVTPPPLGRSDPSATVEIPHWKPLARRGEAAFGGAEHGAHDGDDDATEEMVDLPLTAPFESISLATDEQDLAPASNGQPAPLGRGHSQPSVLSGEAGTAADEKRSKRASFAYGSHGRHEGRGAANGANDLSRKSDSERGILERDESSNHAQPVPDAVPQGSSATAAEPAPSGSQPRIAAPTAHPHTDNPTIAALIAKGLDPKTAPSYLATRGGNESPPPNAADEEKRKKRRSLGVFGMKKRVSTEEATGARASTSAEGPGHASATTSARPSTSLPAAPESVTEPTFGDRPAAPARQPSHGEHAALGTVGGPSMLDKVRNQTRQVTLPPKSREEDEGHLRAWEAMMAEAKAAEQQRQERQQHMREARERKLAESLPVWESILAMYGDNSTRDWREHVYADPKLRRVWFEGCPSSMRGRIWALCIGNGLALSKGAFKSCSVRAQKSIKAGRFPPDVLEQIEKSSATVFPFLKLFQPSSPMQGELQDLLCAWYVSRTDEGLGYIPSIALLAAMLLMTMSLPLAFVSLRNLLERDVLKAFYCRHQDEAEAYYRIFDNLQADLFPKIYANCKHLDVRLPPSYFTTLFLHQLPFDAACRVWDQILLDGDGYIFRVALAILALLEPRLYFPDKQEIQSILEGRNPATLAIVQRERERARLKGLTFNEDIDGVLSVFHVDEQALFERLAQDQWKESRYERLVQREMPDI